MVEMNDVIQQRIMETIINIQTKNCRQDIGAIYKELTKDCALNINVDDIESQIKVMIDNG